MTPAALAFATVDALRRGLEDVFVGDVAAGHSRTAGGQSQGAGAGTGSMSISRTAIGPSDLLRLRGRNRPGRDRGDRSDPHADAGFSRPSCCRPNSANARRSAWRKSRATTSAARPGTGTTSRWASIPERISMRRFIGCPARTCRTIPSTPFRRRISSRRPASSMSQRKSAADADFVLTIADVEAWETRARPHPAAKLGAAAHRLVEARGPRLCQLER